MAGSRKDQYLITLSVDGQNFGVYDMLKGGNVDSDEVKYRPGGMSKEVALGGGQKIGNVTLTRLYDHARDADLVTYLQQNAGRARAVANRQSLDINGAPDGRPRVYTGVVKQVTMGDVDSRSGDPDTYDVEISTEGSVG